MAKILTIITNPNPILRQKSVEFDLKKASDKDLARFCDDMVATMLEADGVGLAAPQIGKNTRLIAVNTPDGPVCMINPKITKASFLKEWGEEGCLSVPKVFGQVRRHKKITCKFTNTDRRPVTVEATGLMARVIQHEIDHLDGILFIDKIKPGSLKSED